MGHRIFCVLVLCAVATAAVEPQPASPHAIKRSGVSVRRLGNLHFSASTRQAIADLVFAGPHPDDCMRAGWSLQQEMDFIRVAVVRLGNRDTDLLVQAQDNCHCGASGNCSFWVLRQTQSGFETLLATYGVQEFSVEPTRSQGYKDLMTASHYSASRQDLVLYRFDGKIYHPSQCATAEYHFAGKKRHGYEIADAKPTIRPEPCTEK